MLQQELVNNISRVCHLSYRDMTVALFISTRQTFVLVTEAHIQSTMLLSPSSWWELLSTLAGVVIPSVAGVGKVTGGPAVSLSSLFLPVIVSDRTGGLSSQLSAVLSHVTSCYLSADRWYDQHSDQCQIFLVISTSEPGLAWSVVSSPLWQSNSLIEDAGGSCEPKILLVWCLLSCCLCRVDPPGWAGTDCCCWWSVGI